WGRLGSESTGGLVQASPEGQLAQQAYLAPLCMGLRAKGTGVSVWDRKFMLVKEIVLELVAPELAGFRLQTSGTTVPAATDIPMKAQCVFWEAMAPAIEKGFKEGTSDLDTW
ncbi:hypothetical protein MC885_004835, partial [Smutsia gigantea]